jgi:hypothetical protein
MSRMNESDGFPRSRKKTRMIEHILLSINVIHDIYYFVVGAKRWKYNGTNDRQLIITVNIF